MNRKAKQNFSAILNVSFDPDDLSNTALCIDLLALTRSNNQKLAP